MDTGLPASILTSLDPPLMVAMGAFVLALLSLILAARLRNKNQSQLNALRERSDTLWREMDDIRVSQFNRSDHSPSTSHSLLDQTRYQTEMEAYQKTWPAIWLLHERLGQFLRTVETGESANDLRLEARNAALDARNHLNQHRPFCHETVDELLTRLIDVEIKAHLAACQYLDLVKEVRHGASDHDRRVLHDKFHSLHEGEARELLNHLVTTIRHRAIRSG
ncbi:hypothetical protein [Marinobacter nauticus]|uniref:Uncharacterized protein n=1 Tax=Marinobacter nauticus TaxID=2743 RepID=A0A833NAE2_MARNT|nr:hypothetical protein [Marinobacter nauticus]KAE8545135.1 hypothetical protein F6453_2466 [Marinobacter nauticus]